MGAEEQPGSNGNGKLHPEEPVEKEIRRLYRERLDAALTTATDESRDRLPHELRKHLKKARALLRLTRPALGKRYDEENDALREVAASFGAARDQQTLESSLRAMKGSNEELAHVRALAEESLAQAEDDSRASAKKLLGRRLQRVDTLTFDDSGWKVLARGLEETYAQGRRRFRRALEKKTPEAFHEWRKSTKSLRFQLQTLKPLWKEELEPLIDELKALGDSLGEDHDLWVLEGEVRRHPAHFGDARQILDRVAARQRELRAKAAPGGERVYAEKPRAFVRRLGAYWKAVQDETHAPARQPNLRLTA